MRSRKSAFGLRARLIGGMLLLVVLLGGAFCVAVFSFMELLETELLSNNLAEELQEFAADYRHDAKALPPSAGGFDGYVVTPESSGDTPPELLPLGPGLHEDVIIDGQEYMVGRQDVGKAHVYVRLNVQPVYRLEARLAWLAMLGTLLACGLTALVAAGLSRWVMQPILRLSQKVSGFDPRHRLERLQPQFQERETEVIASAFDRFIERLDDFVTREQTFTEDVSHELRTPLATIASAIDLLMEQADLDEATRRRVARMQRATRQMQGLIESLLFLAREDGGLQVFDYTVEEIVEEAVAAQREQLAGRPVSLQLSAQGPPQIVRVPLGMATSVINNLIANAAQYTPSGRIEVRLEAGHLEVSDTGLGIAPEELPQVFERRYRGATSRGNGIGLYLVKRICERLGWQLEVSSTAGVGTRFDVHFTTVRDPGTQW
ncbi:MAG: sensor histidine kinase [Hydrocarboniphaga sp.]|uniref:sensor histidine kinase n=1 Tax=Hydrocarboniphaga sp. TaxID=2033016 RepID=UPI00262D0F49|nr:HAMP domain-containing sensor histidine kinase [Hydrocarboniphaga sp.]MDB5969737.1 sensor histidine kinase [Hydrocarboniphaga sp.]